MFPPLRPPTVALACAGEVLRAAVVLKGKVVKLCEQELSLKSLSVDAGLWFPKEGSQIVRAGMRARNVAGGGRATVLLPPDRVYTHQFVLPPLPLHECERMVPLEVQKLIPEELSDLVIATRVLVQSPQAVTVGVAAVRRDILRGAFDLATQSGLKPGCVTTPAAALAPLSDAWRQAEAFVLICAPSAPDRAGTITLFVSRWPADEALVFPGMSPEHVLGQARAIIRDHEGKGPAVTRVVILAGQELGHFLRDAFSVPPPTTGGGIGEPIPVEMLAVPGLTADETHWASLFAACKVQPADLLLNLNLVRKPRKPSRAAVIAVAVAGTLGTTALALSAFLFPEPPPRPPPPPSCRQLLADMGTPRAFNERERERLSFLSLCATLPLVLPPTHCASSGSVFTDVPSCTLLGHGVAELKRLTVVNGHPDGTFRPAGAVSRAEAAKMLLSACPAQPGAAAASSSGATAFSDVPADAWFAPTVAEASARGVVAGDAGKDTFRPLDEVSRAELLAMLTKACLPAPESVRPTATYADVEPGDWYAAYAPLALAYELFPEESDAAPAPPVLRPNASLTRGELAVALYQFLLHRQRMTLPLSQTGG